MSSFFQRLFGRLYDAPYLLLLLATLFWASNFIAGRYAVGLVPPVALSTLRWILATLILLPFAWPYLRADWPVIRRHAGFLLLLSMLSISAYNALTYYGLQYTEVVNATILQSVTPLLMVACAFLIYGERIGRRQLAGMMVSLAGIGVIVSRGEFSALLGFRFNAGDFFLLGAVVGYSIYSVLLRRQPAMHPLSFVTLTMGWGALVLLPFYAAETAAGLTMRFELTALLIVVYLAVFPSIAAHFFFYRTVGLIGSNRAAPVLYLIPVFASAAAVLLLDEPLHPFHAAGFALVLGGVLMATRRQAPAASAGLRT